MKNIRLKIKFFISISLICIGFLKAQTNLVLNPSFESYTACPNNLGNIYNATGWDISNGSPDYFNPCSSVSSAQVPNNAFGYQFPSNGNCYSGVITYYNSSLVREILGGQLISPLNVSQKYFFSFMVNRGNDNLFVGYSTNKIGLKFSKVKASTYTVSINNMAHYSNNTVITDTLNWVRLSGSFVSDSAYQYIMLGNFFDDANTTITNQSSGIYAYYFIDDVCVSTDSAFTYNYATNIKQFGKSNKIKIYPNPASDFIIVDAPNEGDITIQNCYGQEIKYTASAYLYYLKIKTSEWENGIYFLKIDSITCKFIINN